MNRPISKILFLTCLVSFLVQIGSHAQQLSVAQMPRQVTPGQTGAQPATYPAYSMPASNVPAIIADPSRELGVGDSVTFSIAEDNDPPSELRVTDTGELDIPYIGRVSVSGKTCAQASSIIKSRLEDKYYYHATVNLGINQVNTAVSAGQIFVSGCVRQPGPQPFYASQKTTVSAAILQAGGFTSFAESRKVRVTRKSGGSSKNFTIDVKAILEKGQVQGDIILQDGDYVNVPQRLINF